jgi:hypothetical protein
MEIHDIPTPYVIPLDDNWKKCGVWEKTLDKELREIHPLLKKLRTMCLKSTAVGLFLEPPFVFGIRTHVHPAEWSPLDGLPGYKYCWDSTDGRGLDQLNIYGPFDKEVAKKIIRTLEKRGLELRDRWDLLITFGK